LEDSDGVETLQFCRKIEELVPHEIGKSGVIFYHPCQGTTMKGIPIGRLNDSGHNGKASILYDIFFRKD